MLPPIYMYYKLTDYYQNHRRYLRSRDDSQLMGNEITEEEAFESSSCQWHVTNGPKGDPSSLISPCGLVAWSVFNDSFTLSDASGATIPLDETGIAWPSDLEYKFKNSQNGSTGNHFPPFTYWRNKRDCVGIGPSKYNACEDAKNRTPEAGWCFRGSGYCVEDEHFVVWMRAAGLANFRKLYATINVVLEPGTYTVTVSNGAWDEVSGVYWNANTNAMQPFLYPVDSFGGTKALVLSTTTWMGGRNFFLGYAYVVVGVVASVLALCFLIKYRISPRELASASYISWEKESAD